jgi:hypothetical protein
MEPTPVNEEERIAALEKRVQYMDALVRGLTAEFLELKAMAIRQSRQAPEPRVRPAPVTVTAGPETEPEAALSAAATPEGTIVIRPKGAARQDAPETLPEPEMVQIMQADGTMKLEARYGDKKTVSTSAGSGRIPKVRSPGRKNP